MANRYKNRLKAEEEAEAQAATAAEAEAEEGELAQVKEVAVRQLTTAAMRSRVTLVRYFNLYPSNMTYHYLVLENGSLYSEKGCYTVHQC